MKVVNKNKVLVIGIISLIMVNFSVLIYQKYTDKETNIPKVKLKDQEEKKDTFAIMLEQDDGTYQATDSTSFNQPGYKFNNEKSGCIDVNGNKVDNALSYNETTKAISLRSNGTAYCYVYFDKFADPNELITTLANPSEIAYDGTADNNLRYIGKNPNNYIYFNCSDYNNPTASTCEKWRIIGAFNNMKTSTGKTKSLLKIIRNEILGEYSWDYKLSGVGTSNNDNGSNDWTDSQLMLMLNGVTLGNYKSGYTISGGYLLDKNNIKIMNISGSYYEGSSKTYTPASTRTTSGFTGTTTVNFSSTGLKNDTTREMIENVVWKLGGATIRTGSVRDWYSNERGTTVYSGHSTEWTGKIGLMYVSDYGYATGGNGTPDRETCLATDMSNWGYCRNNDWLYNDSLETTITPDSGNSYGGFRVRYDFYMSTTAYVPIDIRPSVYLTSNIEISGGAGSSTSPYIIKSMRGKKGEMMDKVYLCPIMGNK